jgi:hypothetical protein
VTSSRLPPERADGGSPGSRPERASLPAEAGEPNGACALPSPPHGEAAGGLSAGDGPSRPEVVEHAHALLRWAVPAVGKFPRSFRFTLGERIERRLYDVLELLVRASYAKRAHKRPLLGDANVALEVLRHELRLALGFGLLTARQIEHATRLLDAVGRQVGGWLRTVP